MNAFYKVHVNLPFGITITVLFCFLIDYRLPFFIYREFRDKIQVRL